jgi:hypothetical protein
MSDVVTSPIDVWDAAIPGGPGVAGDVAARMRGLFLGLNVVGTESPPYRPLSRSEPMRWSSDQCRPPRAVWVGLGNAAAQAEVWHGS